MPKTLLPHLLTISEFATIKNVSVTAVYQNVKSGKLDLTYVGKSNVKFIDGRKYLDFKFNDR